MAEIQTNRLIITPNSKLTSVSRSQVLDDAPVQGLEGLERLHLIMGLQCNVRCTMCYQTDFSPKFNMQESIYKEKLRAAYRHVKSVKLQGGEPTIMKNCREAAMILRDYPQAKLTIITNGVFIDDFWHETFVHQGGCISFSINAASQQNYDKIVIHGEYNKVIRNIERLLASRKDKTPLVGMNAVILKDNFSELHKMIEMAGKLGVDYFEFLVDPILSYAGLPGRDEVQAELARCAEAADKAGMQVSGLADFNQKFALPLFNLGSTTNRKSLDPCPAPFHNLVVDWDGSVRVCCNTWVELGNINEMSLLDIWQSKNALLFREKMSNNNYFWCSPGCSDNVHPSKFSLLHKYWYEFNKDPKQFTRKVTHKVQQLRGKLIKPKKRTRELPDPKKREQ